MTTVAQCGRNHGYETLGLFHSVSNPLNIKTTNNINITRNIGGKQNDPSIWTKIVKVVKCRSGFSFIYIRTDRTDRLFLIELIYEGLASLAQLMYVIRS